MQLDRVKSLTGSAANAASMEVLDVRLLAQARPGNVQCPETAFSHLAVIMVISLLREGSPSVYMYLQLSNCVSSISRHATDCAMRTPYMALPCRPP